MIIVTTTYVCDKCLKVESVAQLAYPYDTFGATPPDGWGITTPRLELLCDDCIEEREREEVPDGNP